jgi:hypothetical protein
MKTTTTTGFEVWRTVDIGSIPNNTEGYQVGELSIDMLSHLLPFENLGSHMCDLVKVSGSDLGFDKSVSKKTIYTRAQQFGLMPCHRRVGVVLRSEYGDQPLNEWLLMGMVPVADSELNPQIFTLGNVESGLWLSAVSGLPDFHWAPSYVWVFIQP